MSIGMGDPDPGPGYDPPPMSVDAQQSRPNVGDRFTLDGESVTVVPTGGAVPSNEVNVMAEGGSVRTVATSRLTAAPSYADGYVDGMKYAAQIADGEARWQWEQDSRRVPGAQVAAQRIGVVVQTIREMIGRRETPQPEVDPTIPLALALGRLRDNVREEYREWQDGDRAEPSPTVSLSVLYARLTKMLTEVVGPAPLIEHDEKVRARVLEDETLPRLFSIAFNDPGRVVKRDFDHHGEGYPEPLYEWQQRAVVEALRRLRLREGDPL